MKMTLFVVLILHSITSCNSDKSKMVSLLEHKKHLENDLDSFVTQTRDTIAFNFDAPPKIKEDLDMEIKEDRIIIMRQIKIDSFKMEIDRVKYSIDSMSKLK